MNRKRRAYSAGSARNGAGNHRYTPEERAAIDNNPEIIAAKEMMAAAREKAKLDRKLARKKKVLLEKGYDLITAEVLEGIETLAEWDTKEVTLTCPNGHTHGRTGLSMSRIKPGAEVCPSCSYSKRGAPRADARLRYRIRLDEQGFDGPANMNLSNRVKNTYRATGEVCEHFSYQISNWRVPSRDRTIRFVADENDHVFIWMGPKPIVKHPFIADLLATCEVQDYADYGGVPMLKLAIEECVAEGDKVLNLTNNESWSDVDTLNIYSWGKIPHDAALADYIDMMKRLDAADESHHNEANQEKETA